MENGDIKISIDIIPNKEFYNRIMELQPDISILSPRDIGIEANFRAATMMESAPYCEQVEESGKDSDTITWDDDFNLFSNV